MSKAINTIFAAAAGFAAGILLAPKSGKETREDIKVKAMDTKDYLGEKTDKTMEVVKDSAAKAQVEARGMAESVKKSAGTIAAEANFLSHEAKERANNVADKTKQSADKK